MGRVLVSILSLLVLTAACNREKSLSYDELISYVAKEKNGLKKKRNVSGYLFDVQLVPHTLDSSSIADHSSEHYQKFVIKIQPEGASQRGILDYQIESQNDFFYRLEYYTTYVENDLYLVTDSDSISCSFSHFERYYGLSPHNTLVAYFEKPGYNGDLQLIYDDKVLGTGIVKFLFRADDINNIPQLKPTKK